MITMYKRSIGYSNDFRQLPSPSPHDAYNRPAASVMILPEESPKSQTRLYYSYPPDYLQINLKFYPPGGLTQILFLCYTIDEISV